MVFQSHPIIWIPLLQTRQETKNDVLKFHKEIVSWGKYKKLLNTTASYSRYLWLYRPRQQTAYPIYLPKHLRSSLRRGGETAKSLAAWPNLTCCSPFSSHSKAVVMGLVSKSMLYFLVFFHYRDLRSPKAMLHLQANEHAVQTKGIHTRCHGACLA